MTLQEFLDAVAIVPDEEVRLAMTRALQFEAPRTTQEYGRFYRRVVTDLERRREERLSAVA